jgi:hypothetical protein
MVLIGLPVDVDGGDKRSSGSELFIQARGAGLSLQTSNAMRLRRGITFKVSFPKGTDFESFRVEAEPIWRDVYFWEDWKGYQYALKFSDRLNGHYLKLKRLLCELAGMGDTPAQVSHRRTPV